MGDGLGSQVEKQPYLGPSCCLECLYYPVIISIQLYFNSSRLFPIAGAEDFLGESSVDMFERAAKLPVQIGFNRRNMQNMQKLVNNGKYM